METIEMMVRNAKALAEANIDWSLTAGPIWLAGMVVGVVVLSVVFGIEEVRRDRRNARLALYRRAERMGVFRGQVRDSV
jgi:hypothetical protein